MYGCIYFGVNVCPHLVLQCFAALEMLFHPNRLGLLHITLSYKCSNVHRSPFTFYHRMPTASTIPPLALNVALILFPFSFRLKPTAVRLCPFTVGCWDTIIPPHTRGTPHHIGPRPKFTLPRRFFPSMAVGSFQSPTTCTVTRRAL